MSVATAMVDAGLLMTSGLLGSAHCVGMCGPIVVSIGGASPSPTSNLGRQTAFTLGRVMTYAFLGATGGFVGRRFLDQLPSLIPVQAVLAIVAGVVLVGMGLSAAGYGRWTGRFRSWGCGAAKLVRPFLTGSGPEGALVAGVFTGFLPCGLVYGMLSLAISSGGVLRGAAIMACFGLGTAPALIAIGCGGSLASPAIRAKVMRVAALSLVVTGLVAAARGLVFLASSSDGAPPPCPFCG